MGGADRLDLMLTDFPRAEKILGGGPREIEAMLERSAGAAASGA
jgi:hypothetical protein